MSGPLITGWTMQLGGPMIPCTEGIENDREWFTRHHGRNYRLRPPLGGERVSLEIDRVKQGVPLGWKPLVIVKQVEPDARIRAACWVSRRPLNSEATASELFGDVTRGGGDGALVQAIEAGVREGRL